MCPSLVDTPILDRLNPGLPPTRLAAAARALMQATHPWPYPPDRLAQDILHRLSRNTAVIIAPARARAVDRLARHAPRLADTLNRHLSARALRNTTTGRPTLPGQRATPAPQPPARHRAER
ncbi:hypothetical protein J7E96_36360 [Streptomyces sp. ISL-96]|uniref:hypothetical protein n=1 Tax=Streptomyces sp. ISL-96 TaxID=2819191 RepID=UPI001BEC973F|nr:hypothetical protein [Streptomyces sp. ISL-96]MBT2493874.1 hypothetical protein [Streptomyces sp. ISL-96]